MKTCLFSLLALYVSTLAATTTKTEYDIQKDACGLLTKQDGCIKDDFCRWFPRIGCVPKKKLKIKLVDLKKLNSGEIKPVDKKKFDETNPKKKGPAVKHDYLKDRKAAKAEKEKRIEKIKEKIKEKRIEKINARKDKLEKKNVAKKDKPCVQGKGKSAIVRLKEAHKKLHHGELTASAAGTKPQTKIDQLNKIKIQHHKTPEHKILNVYDHALQKKKKKIAAKKDIKKIKTKDVVRNKGVKTIIKKKTETKIIHKPKAGIKIITKTDTKIIKKVPGKKKVGGKVVGKVDEKPKKRENIIKRIIKRIITQKKDDKSTKKVENKKKVKEQKKDDGNQ